MSVGEIPEAILEAALHAVIARRCERAYVHDLRNGLQSIYASIDVLTRMLSGKSAPTLSHDKVADMARKAINAYEQSLNHIAKRLIVQDDTPQAVNVDASLQELCAFLRNDATARGIALQATPSGDSYIRARPSKFRLTLLSVTTRVIDALRGGGLTLSASDANESVTIKFAAQADEISDDALWLLGRSPPPQGDWMLYATQKMAAHDNGVLECDGDSAGVRNVRLIYRATRPSS